MNHRGTSTTHSKSKELRRGALGGVLAAAVVTGACGANPTAEALDEDQLAVQPSPIVDARRSLAITDQPILANFTLARVLGQLVSTSGVSGLTATQLFHQLWDTQNAAPGLDADALSPNCTGSLNGYPYECRPDPEEGAQATCDPFAANSPCAYIPVGLFMRFDLAPSDGRHCGEYRVVFAKESGRFPTGGQNRNLLIFEAAARNPHDEQGIRGCQRLVRAFAELSDIANANTRRTKLEQIYFDGYQEFDPVISYENFGENPHGAGQLRTNQFVQPDEPRMWNLREYKLDRECTPTCTLRFVPVTNKVNPFGPLFDPASQHANASAFQAEFVTQVASLASNGATEFAMNTSDVFNSGQSLATSLSNETNYPVQFGAGPSPFHTAIQTALTNLGSTLTPVDIVKRAQVQACAGCHRFSNNANLGGTMIWPPSLGFTHVSERDVDLETVAGVTRFKISDALVNLLLPARKKLVEDFLNEVPLPIRAPADPIGGRRVH
ncbi:MAG TPA: hypothetical protein VFZ53_02745 [Polyangiaceae bacterium]